MERETNALLLSTRNFAAGATAAFREYGREATNAAQNAHDAFTNSFRALEDTLTKFFSGQKTSFKELFQSIQQEFVRAAVRQTITGPLAEQFGKILGQKQGVSTNPGEAIA